MIDTHEPGDIARQAVENHADEDPTSPIVNAEIIAEIVRTDMSSEDMLSEVKAFGDIVGADKRAAERELVIANVRRDFYRRKIGRYSLDAQRFGRATRAY